MFWAIALMLTLVVALFVIAPLLRQSTTNAANQDVALYKSQLKEIENDVARGLLDEGAAERTRTEIARRLIAANRISQSAAAAPPALSKATAAGLVVFALIASVFGYLSIGAPGEPDQPLAQRLALAEQMRQSRPSQAEFEAAAPPLPPFDQPDDYMESVQQLRDVLATRQDDIQGWRLLVRQEANLLNYSAAAKAQEQVVRLSQGSVQDKVTLVDLMVAAAAGQVSPEAEGLVREILRQDKENVAGLYYMGLLYDTTDRPDIAFGIWRPIVEDTPDSFHRELAKFHIERAAWRAGVTYTLPPDSGPSAQDIAAAQEMNAEDRAAMITGMVQSLSDRLATEGGSAQDWARLITAYGVLGDTDQAAAIWSEAQIAFASNNDAINLLRDAAQQAGVLE